MISRIRGKLEHKDENRLLVDVNGIVYDVAIPRTVCSKVAAAVTGDNIDLVVYSYLNIDQNRALMNMVGFSDELERDFFEKFISVSGVGPKAAIKAFDKPIAEIARAIENGDINFLKTLSGIGPQRAKQIVAQLQGKVGRFALLKEEKSIPCAGANETIAEAKQVLKRLGYSVKEIDEMTARVAKEKPQIDKLEDFLNEVYKQKKVLP